MDYHAVYHPYVLLKDSQSTSLLNTSNKKIYKVADSKYDVFGYQNSLC